MPETSLVVEEWPIDRLKEYPRNPRKNDPVVVERMVKAITEYGFRIPVVARSKDGLIVDGHLRWRAAQQMGLVTVPVALADNLSEAWWPAFFMWGWWGGYSSGCATTNCAWEYESDMRAEIWYKERNAEFDAQQARWEAEQNART